jgi:hypothetical protein
MRLGFKGWKILFASRLVEIMNKYPDKRDLLEPLLFRLKELKSRDLTPFIADLYQASKEVPELQEFIPKPEEILEWFKSPNGN